jgi:predicted amidohydrolase
MLCSRKAFTLSAAGAEVRVGAMICADREFPELATQLMLNGAELIVVPNTCTWDDIRAAGLKTRVFENLVGMAVANYPAPMNNGNYARGQKRRPAPPNDFSFDG